MAKKIVKSFVICAFVISLVISPTFGQTPNDKQSQPVTYGSPFDEIIVESSLNIRKKPTPVRQSRSFVEELSGSAAVRRVRREDGNNFPNFENFGPNFGNFGSSSALANANAQNQYFGQNGFGGSAANAGAQSFESHGPLGGFGAAASNAQSQGFNVGPNGITGSAGLSGGQTYNLPNGQTLSLTYGNTVSFGPDGKPTVSRGNSIAFS
ncbi:uncharacterized protein LOC129801590 [Phlebotomus papatasi]|uniref:uncharacterized protein LOC129801590 n=1 Tax=Phlebotomus papatasi TaxID=29031 RepID=UPI00248410EA|nr:uncharacterized protein LOC129801590 [Phlebotomus papatasi]